MLLITLALLGLIQIQQDLFQQQQLRFSVWLGWAIVNSIGLYVQYFFILAFIALVSNFVFQKPYNPQLVAQNMNQEPAVPLMVVVGYQDYQDVALGLSFALALEKIRSDAEFAFFKRSLGYEYVWQKLSQLQPPANQLNPWVVAPGLKQQDYPSQLEFNQNTCTLDFT